jgi:TRAP-type C4-dicarboxylate transport system substrate-binding protein
MKKVFRSAALAMLFVSSWLTAVCVQPAIAETVTLKAVTAWPKMAVEYRAFTLFTDLVDQIVAKKAPGELKLQYVGGPEAVKAADQAQALQRGMVDLIFTAGAYYQGVLPDIDALKLTDFNPWEERANGASAYINDLHAKKGIHYLGRLGLNLQFHLFMKKPIKTADLKGLNIRVSPLYLPAVKGLGGNPTVIPIPDVYSALERNVVDGAGSPLVGIREYGWQKHVKYMIDPGFYTVVNPLLINLEKWNKLSPKLQGILNEACSEAEKKAVALFADLAKQERPLLVKEGVEIVALPPAEAQKFLKVVYDEGWKEAIQKNPQTGPELKKLLTKAR